MLKTTLQFYMTKKIHLNQSDRCQLNKIKEADISVPGLLIHENVKKNSNFWIIHNVTTKLLFYLSRDYDALFSITSVSHRKY